LIDVHETVVTHPIGQGPNGEQYLGFQRGTLITKFVLPERLVKSKIRIG
jgi:hypothetical protein